MFNRILHEPSAPLQLLVQLPSSCYCYNIYPTIPPSSISHPIHPYPYLCIIVVISLTSMLTISSGVPFQNMCLLRNNCNLYTYIVICIFALMLPAVFASPRINLMFIFYHMLFISVLCCMPFCNIRMS